MLTAVREGEMQTYQAKGCVRAVREALRQVEMGADLCATAQGVRAHLEVLAERARRVKRYGGLLAGVRLSPYVEGLRAASEANPEMD